MPIVIEPLDVAEIPEVHRIWAAAGLDHEPEGRDSVERIAADMLGGRVFVMGARIDEALIAVVVGSDDGRKGWINRLAVVPSHRRSGVGRALIAACEAEFMQRGIAVAAGLVFSDNEASRTLFESAGYSQPPVAYYRKALTDGS